jgi:hypothetical protein
MRDYRAEFQKLVEDAIDDGWVPMWIDRIEGNDCELDKTDDTSQWFYFYDPEEIKEWN